MRLTLGINTCFAVKRWPRVVDWAPLVRDRLGLKLVQHSFDLADPLVDDGGRLRADIREQRLELHSTFTGLAAYSSNLLLDPDPDRRRAAAAWYSRSIAFTADAGGIATGGHVGAFSVPDWTDPARRAERWAALSAALGTAAREAHGAGLGYLVVENLAAGREPSTMAMLRDLLTEGDADHVPVRLCLDVGHMCVPGTSGDDRDPYAWLRTMGRLSPIIQLQQSDAEGDHHWPFTPRCNAVGRIDADRVIDALGEGGVDETVLILEVIPPFEQEDGLVVDDLVASADYWRAAINRRGVGAD
jgi:sugar phosphate isomerase/epimerase